MSDKLKEIKLLAHNAMVTGKGHVDLTTYALTWLIEQLEQAQAANKCLDCGGSGKVEMSSDPYYAERCICTFDPATLMLRIGELESRLNTANKLLDDMTIDIEKREAANQKLVQELTDITDEFDSIKTNYPNELWNSYENERWEKHINESVSSARQTLSEVKGNG